MSTYALKFSSYVSKYTVYAKMAYQEKTTMSVWRRNLPFVSHIQLSHTINICDSRAVIRYVDVRIRPVVLELQV